MKILVIGAAGMIGRKFCEALAKRPTIGGKPVDELTMADAITPEAPVGAPFSVRTLSADIAQVSVAETLLANRPEIIYHLAAVVSGEAEADFDKGYRVNLAGIQHLFEAIRGAQYRPFDGPAAWLCDERVLLFILGSTVSAALSGAGV